ncbi:hypothetical protein V8E53_011180 [Lactarius tabidus]
MPVNKLISDKAQPLTGWRAKDRHFSRSETQQGTTVTHILESQGQALSTSQKHSKAPQPLTNWRAKDRHCQQARNTARHHSHSQTGEPRTGIVSRPETQQGTTATHFLESQGQALSAGQKHSKAPQPLTDWRAKYRHCQQARNTARHHSHSHSGEPRTGIVSRPETQQGTTVTHILESQVQALSAGQKHSKAPQPLTGWRAKDRHCQQARNTARHHSHSPTGEPRTGIVSRLEAQQGTTATHILESQVQALSAGQKHSKAPQPLTNWRAKDRHSTHILESQVQALSAGQKHSKAPQPLTDWRAKDRHCQQARNTARHHSHSHPGEPRTGIVSRPETQQGTTATHKLESQGQALSAGQKHSKAPQPLTSWRAKDRHCQQARNTARHHSHSHPGEPRTGIVSRPETQQGTTATHRLESQVQALSAGQKHSKAPQPLTHWRAKYRHCQQARNTARHHSHSQTGEPRTGIVSRLEAQQGTTATHILESQVQALSAGQKHSKAPQPLTFWRAKYRHCQQARNTARHHSHSPTGEPSTGIVSRPETQQGTTATHPLESQVQALSAGQKHSKAPQPLTNWRAKDRHCQQARSTARHHSHSHSGEPSTGIVSRPETQQGTTATHRLESQGQALSAGQKHSKAPQPLTHWRAKYRHCQQARNTARHHSYSQAGEPRTGIVSRPETQQGTTATHRLESQGQALSAGQKHSKAPQPLTLWRAKDRHCQQARNTARHHSHSQAGEPSTGIVSRPETQQGTTATHQLESQVQALSAGQKHSKAPQPLTDWRAKYRHCQQARNTARHHSHSPTGEPSTGIVSRPETQQGTTATHRLESQGQALSAGQKHSKAPQPLTSWRAKDRHCQQARNTARHHSHSHPGEPRTGIVSRPETQQGTTATHILESQGQALSAGQKYSKAPQPLTGWRAKDRHCQQARNTARHHSHSHPGEPRTGIVSRPETQQCTTATHQLESQGQALSAGQKHSKAPQPLTLWRAKDRHCQQARNTARHHSHSHPGEPRTGIVSRPETQQGTTATHFLESQGQALSAG